MLKKVSETQEIQTNVGTATGVSNEAGPINRTQSYIAERMIFEMRKRLLNLSLAKPRENADRVLKNYELSMHGDT